MSTRVVVSNRPSSKFVISCNHLVAHGKLSLNNMASVENVSSIRLHVFDLELSDTINDNLTGVIFLTSLFSIKWRLFQQDPKLLTSFCALGGAKKLLSVVNSNNLGLNVLVPVLVTVVGHRNILIAVQGTKYMDVKLQQGLTGLAATRLGSF
ncbi:hypothetical protein OGATHE_005423 [Ogataea polymorpha]|uniref:Uncharacterized protein n=1 Tax=Ogataea polymorpha TaxID=460523 RepID=A0A9P8NX25_9ASCO|nr:hypothetical protein OGATHE_005423 [Ogataea polymorpha]